MGTLVPLSSPCDVAPPANAPQQSIPLPSSLAAEASQLLPVPPPPPLPQPPAPLRTGGSASRGVAASAARASSAARAAHSRIGVAIASSCSSSIASENSSCSTPSSQSPLELGHTLAAVYTLGCPMPLFLALQSATAELRDAHVSKASQPLLPARCALNLQVPSPMLPTLSRTYPKGCLGLSNFYHAADPLACPMASSMPRGAKLADVRVRLNGGTCSPLDYVGKAGSKQIFSPLAYALTHLWLQCNPHVNADTTQLQKLKDHGSGTRAALSKKASVAAERSKRTVAKISAAAGYSQRRVVVCDASPSARSSGGCSTALAAAAPRPVTAAVQLHLVGSDSTKTTSVVASALQPAAGSVGQPRFSRALHELRVLSNKAKVPGGKALSQIESATSSARRAATRATATVDFVAARARATRLVQHARQKNVGHKSSANPRLSKQRSEGVCYEQSLDSVAVI